MTTSAPCCGDATATASVHEQDILTAVQARYGAVALDVLDNNAAGCCGDACCGSAD